MAFSDVSLKQPAPFVWSWHLWGRYDLHIISSVRYRRLQFLPSLRERESRLELGTFYQGNKVKFSVGFHF